MSLRLKLLMLMLLCIAWFTFIIVTGIQASASHEQNWHLPER